MDRDDECARPMAVLDFEASSIGPSSYPIEVGVAFVESGETLSCLIRPDPMWASSGFWAPEAERVHGISRTELLSGGDDPTKVCEWLERAVQWHTVLSDATGLDGAWLRKLYEADGRQPPFALASFWEAAQDASGVGWPGMTGINQNPEVDRALELSRQRFPREHRAGDDARRLAEALRILLAVEPRPRAEPGP